MVEIFIPIILATGREGRKSENVSNYLLKSIDGKNGVRSLLVDVKSYIAPLTIRGRENKEAKELSSIFNDADGFIIVAPEYNHAYPGELKIMLDRLYKEYHRKPLGIAGVSAGILGGARMVEQLRTVAIELHMVPIRNALYFRQVQNLFSDDGKIKNPEDFDSSIETFMEELVWYSRVLKKGRDENNENER